MLHRFSLRSKFILISVLLVTMSLTISGVFFFISYYNALLKATYQSLNNTIDQVEVSMTSNLQALNNLSYYFFTNDIIHSWVNNEIELSQEEPASFNTISNLQRDIQTMVIFTNSWTSRHIRYIYLHTEGLGVNLISRSKKGDAMILNDVDTVLEKMDEFNLSQSYIFPFDNSELVFFAKKIRNITFDKEMTFIYAISQDTFSEGLQRFKEHTLANVVDDEGNIYFSNDPELLGKKSSFDLEKYVPVQGTPNAYTINDKKGEQFLVYRSLGNGLYIMISQPRQILVDQTLNSMKHYLWIMLLTLLVLMIIAIIISASYTRFLKSIITNMNQVRINNYAIRMPVYKNHQLNMISDTFNKMAAKIEVLINQEYRNRILLRENDIRLLQSQMNPHFMVNALTTISTSALLKGEKQTYEAVSALNGLISANLLAMTNDNFVTLESELLYVKLYLRLQHMRFADRFTYDILVSDSELLNLYIPRLSVEPIVENAVIHGIEKSSSNGKIDITIEEVADNLIFTIKDNGVGFDAEGFLAQIDSSEQTDHIGIYNTDKRLKLIFGEKYGLEIKSVIDKGTVVIIRIPVLTKPLKSRDD